MLKIVIMLVLLSSATVSGFGQKILSGKHGTTSYTNITSKSVCDGYSEYFGLLTLIGTIVEKEDSDDNLTVTIRTTRGRKTFNLSVDENEKGGWFYRQVWDDLLSLDSKIRVRVHSCGRLSAFYFAKDIYKVAGSN